MPAETLPAARPGPLGRAALIVGFSIARREKRSSLGPDGTAASAVRDGRDTPRVENVSLSLVKCCHT